MSRRSSRAAAAAAAAKIKLDSDESHAENPSDKNVSPSETRKRSSKLRNGSVSPKKPKPGSDKVSSHEKENGAVFNLSKELSSYFQMYNNGLDDKHLPVFNAARKVAAPLRVLYPGCGRHITPSLIFPDVVYVDSFALVEPGFSDLKVLEWVALHKTYEESVKVLFHCKDYNEDFSEKDETFDLLISLTAEIVSNACGRYLKHRGYLLANDVHCDARSAYLSSQYELLAVYNDEKQAFDASAEALAGYFETLDGSKITRKMVDESRVTPIEKRSFKLKKDPENAFFLFRKV